MKRSKINTHTHAHTIPMAPAPQTNVKSFMQKKRTISFYGQTTVYFHRQMVHGECVPYTSTSR